jgi:hypothetical protein
MREDFCVFILSHGRPNNVLTYDTVRRHGYTGKIIIVLDDLDKTREQYVANYGAENIEIFDKKLEASKTDSGINTGDLRSVLFARNAVFGIAEKRAIKVFLVLDDDYTHFISRFNKENVYEKKSFFRLDEAFAAMTKFIETTNFHSFAMLQGGDFIGGKDSPRAERVYLLRKCMNSFFCRTDRPFRYVGIMNDDVNTYVELGRRGLLFGSTNQISLEQKQTQSNAGGLTDLYLDCGTYVKSFYSVMYQPSSVKVSVMNTSHARIHHRINWTNTVPKILSESLKKQLTP